MTEIGEHPDKLNAIALMTCLPSKLLGKPKTMLLDLLRMFCAARGE
ncbi:MAG TPA: hypothetical protein V6D16_13430 [Candidatus Obscuribacterales bacterium]